MAGFSKALICPVVVCACLGLVGCDATGYVARSTKVDGTTCAEPSPSATYMTNEFVRYYDSGIIERPSDGDPDTVHLAHGRELVPDLTLEKFSASELRCWEKREDSFASYLLALKLTGAVTDYGVAGELLRDKNREALASLNAAAKPKRCSGDEAADRLFRCREGLPEAQYALFIYSRDTAETAVADFWLKAAADQGYGPALVQYDLRRIRP